MPLSTDTQNSRLGRIERFETIVIGGGQAGLAVGHYLASDDANFVILDGASRIGDSWRRRWDSLRLFTPAAYSGLPGMPFPAPPTHLPDKDEVADYLTRYAERFDLPLRLDTKVRSLELAQSRKVWLAGRSPGHLPRRFLGRDLFDWVWPVMKRATTDSVLGQRMRKRAQHGDQRIGISERTLSAAGINRIGRLVDERGGLPVCGDTVIEPRAIVWCTGFEADYRWIQLPVLNERGTPSHRRGVSSAVDGLYFAGLRFQYRLSSSLIGGVGEDAAFVAAQIARRASIADWGRLQRDQWTFAADPFDG